MRCSLRHVYTIVCAYVLRTRPWPITESISMAIRRSLYPTKKRGPQHAHRNNLLLFFFFTTLNSSTWPTANCSTQSSIWEPQTIYGDAIYSCVCTGTTATVGFTLTYIFLLLFVVCILLASCSLRNEKWFHRLWQYRLKIWIVFDVIPLGFNGGKSKLHQPRTLCPCRVANHISNVGYNVVPC